MVLGDSCGMDLVVVEPLFAVEGHEDRPEHVEGGDAGRHGGDAPVEEMAVD